MPTFPPWGKANWEIFAADTTAGDSTEQGGDLYLNIAGLDIRNSGRIVYDSKPDKLYATVDLEHLRLKNTFRHDYKNRPELREQRPARYAGRLQQPAGRPERRFHVQSETSRKRSRSIN